MTNWKEMLHRKLAEQRISARRLSQMAGLSTSTVHDMLNKEGFAPQIDSLRKVFDQLGCTIVFLDGQGEDRLQGWIRQRHLEALTFEDLERMRQLCEQLGTENCLSVLDREPVTLQRVRKILHALS